MSPVFRREEHRKDSVIYRVACLIHITYHEVTHSLSVTAACTDSSKEIFPYSN